MKRKTTCKLIQVFICIMICVYLIGCTIPRVVVLNLQDTSLSQYQGKIKEYQSFEDIKEPYIIVGKITAFLTPVSSNTDERKRKLLLKETSKLGANAIVGIRFSEYRDVDNHRPKIFGIAVLTGSHSSQVSNHNRKPFIVKTLTKIEGLEVYERNYVQFKSTILMNKKGYYISNKGYYRSNFNYPNYDNSAYSLEQIKVMSEKDKLIHFGKETDYILFIEMIDSIDSKVTLYSLTENREIKIVNTEVFSHTRIVRKRTPANLSPAPLAAWQASGYTRFAPALYLEEYNVSVSPIELIYQAINELPDVIGNR